MGDADQIYLQAKTEYTKRLISAIPEEEKKTSKTHIMYRLKIIFISFG